MAGLPKVKTPRRGSGSTRKATTSSRQHGVELNRARTLDDLALHDDLFSGVLGNLKKDIANGVDALTLAKKYANLAQARTVTIALTDENSSTALAASRDVMDRAMGKSIERKETKHIMADSTEEELDAIIASKLELLEESDDSRSDDESDN